MFFISLLKQLFNSPYAYLSCTFPYHNQGTYGHLHLLQGEHYHNKNTLDLKRYSSFSQVVYSTLFMFHLPYFGIWLFLLPFFGKCHAIVCVYLFLGEPVKLCVCLCICFLVFRAFRIGTDVLAAYTLSSFKYLTASRAFHNYSVHFLCFADLRLLFMKRALECEKPSAKISAAGIRAYLRILFFFFWFLP